ncbi:MAG: pantoate--beta-alanine ligase [Deltaproteobacteria bacterium SG8_13]|nr:MAG: pantoate--beta-alanine ligase [Deltaproteobacteria bacterium SG8_13]
MQRHADDLRRKGKRIALVPTMGFLHEGHLSLMRVGRQLADELVVSIFVNPTQFGPGEDFETYPRDLDTDLDLCRREKVNIAFTPSRSEMYPENYQTSVRLDELPNHLCGLSRPVFFTGVATVVTKLFNMVKPHIAVFGEKDYQQLLVIRRMVKDLNLDVEIVGSPLVREADGLAMSSRNNYLTAQQRPAALSLYHSICKARQLVDSGIRESGRILSEAVKIIGAHAENDIDYLAICDTETLDHVDVIERPVLMALAVRVGSVRLIDNSVLEPNRQDG